VSDLTTYLDAMRNTASKFDDGRGIRFYSDQRESIKWSYAELDERARARAVELNDAGYGVGDVAVLAFNPGFGFIESVYAALYAGMSIAPVPVTVARNPKTVTDRISAIVGDSGSRLLLTEPSALAIIGDLELSGVEIATLNDDPDVTSAAEWARPNISADSIALLQYTSGSTGKPKGVMVSHGNLVANETSIGMATGAHSEAVWAGWLPHYHDMGLIGLLLRPIFAGSESILTTPSQFLRRPVFWLRLISQHRATFTVAPDFAYRLCTTVVSDAQMSELDLSSLTHIAAGAEPVRLDTVRAFVSRFESVGVRASAFVPAYGMAETTLLVTASAGAAPTAIAADVDALERDELVTGIEGRTLDVVSCGPPTPGTTLAIVDPATGERKLDGSVGEIWVSGPSVALGYWGRPEESAEAFGASLSDGTGGFLRTGDLGAIVDGSLYVTGRLKDLIIVHGRNIYPHDLELTAAIRVGEMVGCLCAAFELTDQPSEVGLVIEFEPSLLASVDLAQLTTRVRAELLEEFGLTSLAIAVVRKGILPRTTSGKIQRSKARSQLISGEMSVIFADGVTVTPQRETTGALG
jgi:acyl-CoA synthetase (AMP-forming)/AMP-acid ligase II